MSAKVYPFVVFNRQFNLETGEVQAYAWILDWNGHKKEDVTCQLQIFGLLDSTGKEVCTERKYITLHNVM